MLSNASAENYTLYYQDPPTLYSHVSHTLLAVAGNLCGECQDLDGMRMGMSQPFTCRQCAAVWQVRQLVIQVDKCDV